MRDSVSHRVDTESADSGGNAVIETIVLGSCVSVQGVVIAQQSDGLLKTQRDMLLYVLFPQPTKAFLSKKYAS